MASPEPAFWRPEISPSTLILAPAPDGFEAAVPFDPTLIGELIADRRRDADRHIVLADPQGNHTLAFLGANTASCPAALLPLDAAFELRIDVLWRFYHRLRGQAAEPLPRALQLTSQRRARLILILHVLDFHLAGAGSRDIAAALINAKEAVLPAIEWKSSAARRQTNRLISVSLALMKGGYLTLLIGR